MLTFSSYFNWVGTGTGKERFSHGANGYWQRVISSLMYAPPTINSRARAGLLGRGAILAIFFLFGNSWATWEF
jgi:hypothetical protein